MTLNEKILTTYFQQVCSKSIKINQIIKCKDQITFINTYLGIGKLISIDKSTDKWKCVIETNRKRKNYICGKRIIEFKDFEHLYFLYQKREEKKDDQVVYTENIITKIFGSSLKRKNRNIKCALYATILANMVARSESPKLMSEYFSRYKHNLLTWKMDFTIYNFLKKVNQLIRCSKEMNYMDMLRDLNLIAEEEYDFFVTLPFNEDKFLNDKSFDEINDLCDSCIYKIKKVSNAIKELWDDYTEKGEVRKLHDRLYTYKTILIFSIDGRSWRIKNMEHIIPNQATKEIALYKLLTHLCHIEKIM